MKNIFLLGLCALSALASVSCLTVPPARQAGPSADAVDPVSVAESQDLDPEDSQVGEPIQPETAPEPEIAALPEATTPQGETPVAEPSAGPDAESAPVLVDELNAPPESRLLYFYPEPDPNYIPPAQAATETKDSAKTVPPPTKPAATAPAPAPAPAPKAEKKADEEKKSEVMPGIWTAEPVPPAVESVPAVAANPPSRSATLTVGQTLEAWYPGTGWVYLGDASAQNGVSYETRKLDNGDTLFTFKAVKPGDYILEFTRFDVLQDSFSSDRLGVAVVDSASKKSGKVRAPDYRPEGAVAVSGGSASNASVVAPKSPSDNPVSGATTVSSQNPSAANESVSDEPSLVSAPVAASATQTGLDAPALLESARKSLSSGDVSAALTSLEKFFSVAVDSLDEGWFLRGQAYEANGATRDIRKALDAYKTLTAAWPESARWAEADARIRYITRYYLGQ